MPDLVLSSGISCFRSLCSGCLLCCLFFWLSPPASTYGQPAGFLFRAAYTGDLASNLAGGHERGTVYLDNIDLTLTLDLDALAAWKGGTLFLYGLGNQGGRPGRLVGDAQGVNNIEAPETWKLYEAWLEQTLFEERVSVLAGLYDLNSEFDVIGAAGLFIHASHGIGPDFSQSGPNGPSIFPVTSLGARLKLLPVDAFYVQAVVLDGVPGHPDDPLGTHVILGEDDGLLVATEAAYFWGPEAEPGATPTNRHVRRTVDPPYRAKIALGAWTYTRPSEPIGSAASGSVARGAYVLAESDVYRERADRGQGLSVFARAGLADDRVLRFGTYTGLGAVYRGLFDGRDTDELGLAVAAAHNGALYKQALRETGRAVDASEINVEATYLAALTSWLALQADLQYLLNPDTDPSLSNSLVATLRLQVSL